MTAKHRPHQPKRQRSTSDLERRVCWLERHFKRDAASIARVIARYEVDEMMAAHIEAEHLGQFIQFPDLALREAKHAPPN